MRTSSVTETYEAPPETLQASPDYDALRSVQPEAAQFDPADATSPVSGSVTAVSLSAVILVSLWLLLRRSLRLAKEYRPMVHPSQADIQDKVGQEGQATKISCYQCKYFARNMYLPCAVNPALALKPESKDCKDFEAKTKS